MRLVWCQGGNPASARIAVSAGWWYGFRSDDNYDPSLGRVTLLDSHWIDPDFPAHLALAGEVLPWMATVPDTMSHSEIDRTVRQAEQIAPFTDHVLVVPKRDGVIRHIPRTVLGKPVVLGYSVPTSYGGTSVPMWDFEGWPVHLLGGNAKRQLAASASLSVISADGNLAWRLARRGIVITKRGTAGKTIRQLDGERWSGDGAHLEALRRSMDNLKAMWSSRRNIEWNEL